MAKVLFHKSEDIISIVQAGQTSEKLENKIYNLVYVSDTDTYQLNESPAFEIKCKIYGNLHKRTQKVFNTWTHKGSSMGVLCKGAKGTGKSLLCMNIAINAIKNGIPVICINGKISSSFARWISQITQPIIILIDEFGKIFDSDHNDEHSDQVKFLSIMDGIHDSGNILWLLSSNDDDYISPYLLNRPGRIHYVFNYGSKLPIDCVTEFCMDNLKNKDYIENMKIIYGVSSLFSYDMLNAIVNECNLYNISPLDAIEDLNVDMDVHNQRLKIDKIVLLSDESADIADDYVRRSKQYVNRGNLYDKDTKQICSFTYNNITNIDITTKKIEYVTSRHKIFGTIIDSDEKPSGMMKYIKRSTNDDDYEY